MNLNKFNGINTSLFRECTATVTGNAPGKKKFNPRKDLPEVLKKRQAFPVLFINNLRHASSQVMVLTRNVIT
jgi:hypothetical protein